jgi:hypothetical protein
MLHSACFAAACVGSPSKAVVMVLCSRRVTVQSQHSFTTSLPLDICQSLLDQHMQGYCLQNGPYMWAFSSSFGHISSCLNYDCGCSPGTHGTSIQASIPQAVHHRDM